MQKKKGLVCLLSIILFLLSCEKRREFKGTIIAQGSIVDALDNSPIDSIIVYMVDPPKGLSGGRDEQQLGEKDTVLGDGNFSCAHEAFYPQAACLLLSAFDYEAYQRMTNKYKVITENFQRQTGNGLNFSSMTLKNKETNDLTVEFARYGWLQLEVRKNNSGKNDDVTIGNYKLKNQDSIVFLKLEPNQKNKFIALRKNREIWCEEFQQGLSGDTTLAVLQL